MSAHRGITRRRHLRWRGLPCCWRTIWRRYRLQYPDRRCGRVATTGVRTASGATRTQCHDDPGRRVDRSSGYSPPHLPEEHKPCSGRLVALAVGLRADIVLLDENLPDLASRHGDEWLDAWTFVVGRTAVNTVLVGGEIVVEAGRHRMWPAIEERYKRVSANLLAA